MTAEPRLPPPARKERPPLAADEDRLFPADPATRAVARDLFALVERLPILSVHGHVDPSMLADDRAFTDPATLLVTPDHYVTRLLHANGVRLDRLLTAEPRDVWAQFCAGWPAFAGTATGYWIAGELYHLFGIPDDPSPSHFDLLTQRLAQPDFRPRALFGRFNLEVLATTDDPLDSLTPHRRLVADGLRVIPTFRPDRYVLASNAGWAEAVERLIGEAGDGRSGYAGYLHALESRRAYFIELGAVSADHGSANAQTIQLDRSDAAALFDELRGGELSRATVFEAHMLYVMAAMSVRDGLVMTVHPGIHRNHHRPTWAAFGPDTGHDIPVRTDFTAGLAPLLADSAPRRSPGAVHHRRDDLLAGVGPAGRLLPVGLSRCALVVPGRARRDPPVPRGGHRNRRVLPIIGVHR